MFSFKRLEQNIWYFKRLMYLKSFERHATSNLSYFKHIRENDMMRQEIGRRDLNRSLLPRSNPKKIKYHNIIPYFNQSL